MDAEMQCSCGAVRGRAKGVSARSVNRVVCYCDDCQAFLHHLERGDLLDAFGGTDIVQMAPAALTFEQGKDKVSGIRLSPKGLYRWYATCCNTPLGNTVGPSLPLVGVVVQDFTHSGQDLNTLFGPPVGAVQAQFATQEGAQGTKGFGVLLLVRMMRKMLAWKLRGLGKPNPFFASDSGAALFPVTVLSREERQALRAVCGPHPHNAPK